MSDSTSSLIIRVRVADVQSSMAQLKAFSSGVQRLFAPLAAVGSVAGFTALAKAGLHFADTISKVRQSLGLTTREMAGLAFAAERDDVALDSLKVALKDFSKHLIATGQGSRNIKEALLEEAAAFQRLPDGAAKSARAVALFGRAGLEMIPLLNQGPEQLQELIERGGELSGVNEEMSESADEFNDALGDLKIASQGLAASLVSMLLPAITRAIGSATDGIVAFRHWAQESEAFKVAIEALTVSLGAFTAYKLGLAGTAFLASIFGPIKSISDFTTALKLIPAAALAGVGSIATLTISIAALTAVIVAGIEAWKLWKARKEEALAEKEARSGMEALATAIDRAIEKQRKAGVVTQVEAGRMKAAVNDLNKEWQQGVVTLGEYQKQLSAISDQLISLNKAPVRFLSGDEQRALFFSAKNGADLQMARAEADAAVAKAAVLVEEKRLEDSYNRRLITVEQYYERKRKLEEQILEAEKRPKLMQLDRLDLELDANRLQVDATEKGDQATLDALAEEHNRLLTDRVKVIAELMQLDHGEFMKRFGSWVDVHGGSEWHSDDVRRSWR